MLLFCYFAARWEEPYGDVILNEQLGEKTNIAAKLISLAEDKENSVNVVMIRESELRLINYAGRDLSEDTQKAKSS